MSDIGFSELLLLVTVALIVIGPKRLPEAARFLGYWVGKLRRGLHNARRDMERELGLDDIRREVHNQLLLEQLEAERQQVAESLRRAQSTPAAPAPAPRESPEEIEFVDDDGAASPRQPADPPPRP
ncbi:MAG: Sec-independent protein translocase protein TatB [Pseudomonadota bacterium]